MNIREVADRLELDLSRPLSGVSWGPWADAPTGEENASLNPATEEVIGRVKQAGAPDYEAVLSAASAAFERWRMVPAPKRGEIVRELGDELRRFKEPLACLVALEMGKILPEGLGEVQEAIDIADFAVGLSRQLYGLSMHSERPHHRMLEQWHPLGVVGVITAFNFPVAVWAWNVMIAAVCGDTCVWKPSHHTPLVSVAVQKICNRVFLRHGHPGVMCLMIGSSKNVGRKLVADRRVPLISATGSCRMGQEIGRSMADRYGRMILELGGNNGVIVMDDASLDLALRAVLFGAVGTAGQRCTSTRRLFLQDGIRGAFTDRLIGAYKQVRIGDPLAEGTLMGPLVDRSAVETFHAAIKTIRAQGGRILHGGGAPAGPQYKKGLWVEPTIVEATPDLPLIQEETFAPILYVMRFKEFEEALAHHNAVPQGLSSSLFTTNLQTAETWLSARGSDCGIANVNVGTSGAEIGGAFGGEKDTGGGREAGSDSWKQYMRRQTCTTNWGKDLPLAQGIQFG